MKNVILSSILFGTVAFMSTSCEAIVVENQFGHDVMMSVTIKTNPGPGAGNSQELYAGHQHIADQGVVAFDIPQANIDGMLRYVASKPNEYITMQLSAFGLGNPGVQQCAFRIKRVGEINTLKDRSFKVDPHLCYEVTPPNVGAVLTPHR